MEEFIDKYFENGTIEFPRNIAFNPLPWGSYWEYVSSTFLNGFINYVEIKKAFLLARYTHWNEQLDMSVSVREPPEDFKPTPWVNFSGTKEEVYQQLTMKGAVYHSKLDVDFQDDVLILARIVDDEALVARQFSGETPWILFWFDRDGSDCCIGRFLTGEPEDKVLADFEAHAMSLDFGILDDNDIKEKAREIPLHYFAGWLGSR